MQGQNDSERALFICPVFIFQRYCLQWSSISRSGCLLMQHHCCKCVRAGTFGSTAAAILGPLSRNESDLVSFAGGKQQGLWGVWVGSYPENSICCWREKGMQLSYIKPLQSCRVDCVTSLKSLWRSFALKSQRQMLFWGSSRVFPPVEVCFLSEQAHYVLKTG